MEELLARIRAALRHAQPGLLAESRVVTTPTLHLDLGDHVARRDGEAVHLTPTEWRLVDVLTRHPGALVRQSDLLREVWGPAYDKESNYLRVFLAQVRRKLEVEPGRPRHFITDPGVGYRFVP
jgi:two-component system KDP operon response regulator KdpE